MKIIIKVLLILFQIFLFQSNVVAQELEECTIGVASGKATSDGRPLIWKTRDNSSAPNNELVYNTSFDLKFLEIVTAGKTYAWMGVNENGFAILNSLASDLPTGSTGFSNGALMREALGTCSSISEFQDFLDETNTTGRKTHGNFAVLDSSGEAALYEIAGTTYWKYNADDSLVAPEGYVIRTNFALNGDGSGSGYERFERSADLIHTFYRGDTLNYNSILKYQMRTFSDYDGQGVSVPYPNEWTSGRPYGYIYTDVSICRAASVSATVIQGILPGESEKLTTMWTMLGQPAASITVPYWPVGETPEKANGSSTAPLCDIALQIKSVLFDYPDNSSYIDSYKLLDGEGNGLWTETFPVEDSIFSSAEKLLSSWRTGEFTVDDLLTTEENFADLAYEALNKAYNNLITDVEMPILSEVPSKYMLNQNYPNPFNPSTTIEYSLPSSGYVTLNIYNLLGEKVITLVDKAMKEGVHSVTWIADHHLTSGVYIYRINVSGDKEFTASKKLILLK